MESNSQMLKAKRGEQLWYRLIQDSWRGLLNFRGVTCSVNDAVVHPECFQCSTCGASLKNVGHHYINEKFYCDIHGIQRKQQTQIPTQESNGRPAPPILNTMNRRPLNPDLVVYALLNPYYYNNVFLQENSSVSSSTNSSRGTPQGLLSTRDPRPRPFNSCTTP